MLPRASFSHAILLALSALLLACAGGGGGEGRAPRRVEIDHEYSLVPGKAHRPEIARALIFPMNATIKPIAGLEVANDDLMRLIEEFLAARGVTSTALSPRDLARANRNALSKVRKQMMSGESGRTSDTIRLGDVLPEMLEELGSDAQIVLLPNVVVRPAEYSGARSLRWDGVRRRERVVGLSMSGTIGAGSLYTMIYDRTGERIFGGYGGLDPIYEIVRSESKYVVRADLFEDLENLAEGVCISLHPYFDTVDC